MAKKASPVVKVLRESTFSVTIDLNDADIDEVKDDLVALLRRADDLKTELKTVQTAVKNKIQVVNGKISASRSMIDSRKRDVEVPVREVLLSSNEVATIRIDNGEEIGRRRTATPSEMQEDLPMSDGDFQ